MKKLNTFFDDGVSKIEGLNVGKYPLHHFFKTYAGNENKLFRYPLNIEFSGMDEWCKGCYRKRTNSELFAIEFIREGSLSFIQNGKKYLIEKDQLFIIRPGTDNEVFMEKHDYCLKMTSSISGPLLEPLLISLGIEDVDCIQLSNPLLLEEIMQSAIEELKNKKEGFHARCSEIAYNTLLQLGMEYKRSFYPISLANAVSFLENNIHNTLPLNTICESLGISQSTLNRLFRKYLGMAPVEYFINQKMLAAKEMLKNDKLSIKEIAESLGYSNQLYFSTEFRKRNGTSPREFRFGKKPTTTA